MQFNFETADNEYDSEFEDLNIDEMFQINDSVIFLVDVHSLFYINPNVEETNLDIFFHSFQAFLKNKIISSQNNKCALIFYNTLQTNNPFKLMNIYIVKELGSISPEDIKMCDQGHELIEQIGRSEQASKFDEALWICSSQFSNNSNQTNSFNRLFIFTCDDNPCKNNQQLQTVKEYLKLMEQNHIDIELFPLVFENNKFDVHKFYFNEIKFDKEDFECGLLDGLYKLEQLQIRLKRKEVVKKCLLRTHLQLSQKNRIGIRAYSIYRKLRPQTSIPIHKKDNQKLQRYIKNTHIHNHEVLDLDQIGKYHLTGNAKIPFEEADLQSLKTLVQENFTLIGFKSRDSLKKYFNKRPSLFLVPDDDMVLNSSQAFDALIKELLKRDQIAIAKLKKQNSQIIFLALIPQNESIDRDKVIPPGFHVIILPYADDIRDLTQEESITKDVQSDELQMAYKLICSLSVDNFDPKNFENPNLQKFYSVLQNIALNEENFEDIDDCLQPDIEGFYNQEQIIEDFKQFFFNSLVEDETQVTKDEKTSKKIKNKTVQNSQEKDENVFLEEENQVAENQIQKIERKIIDGKFRSISIDQLDMYLTHKEINFSKMNKKQKYQEALKIINSIKEGLS